MDQLIELENTFIEEYKAGNLLIKNNLTKSSIIMFSKSMFALIDYLIFKKYNKLPKNHRERFRILEIKEEEIYFDLDKLWSKYTNSYTKPSTTDAMDYFKKFIKKIIKENEEFSEKIKKVFEE